MQKILYLPKLLPFALLVFAIALLFPIFPLSALHNVPLRYPAICRLNSPVPNIYWSTVNPFIDVGLGRLNSMLSITVLPTNLFKFIECQPWWLRGTISTNFFFCGIGLIFRYGEHLFFGRKYTCDYLLGNILH